MPYILESKNITRTFQLYYDMGHLNPLVPRLLDLLKVDEIGVFHPDRGDVYSPPDENGAYDLLAAASLQVNLREWLPVACQYIRLDYDRVYIKDTEVLGSYKSNLPHSILKKPYTDTSLPGPAAFSAGIYLNGRVDSFSEEQCLFVLAHELVHVFRFMPVIVPAFLNWEAFQNHEDLCASLEWIHGFVDSYGEENELREIQAFWPDDLAQQWFESLR